MIAKKKKIKKSSKIKKISFSFLVGIFLLAIVGFLVFSNWQLNKKRGELISKIEQVEQEISLLEQRNEELKEGIIQTEESEAYWEARVREQGYKRPGEEVIVVLPPEEQAQKEPEIKKGILESIKEALGF